MAGQIEQSESPETPVAARGGLRVETWMFLGLTSFFAIAAVVYGLLAPTEPAGIVALALTAGLTFIVGTFLMFISRRLEAPRPEDNDDAEVSDGAGDVGFFSPGSYWPFFLAVSVALLAYATAFVLWWLMTIGLGFVFYSICGLLFEYHRRPAH